MRANLAKLYQMLSRRANQHGLGVECDLNR